ncbi:invasion associated locus B family protein, partial [Mesorhizobium sp. M7A.F.Ca.CA.002.03.2.1]|uniref:invasion associated locus B family protein n=1 Tax=Mesorhizobium sp. M7A.F.Ca.CA.002.03.2.1 TaxID=2496680 RepID=UPI001FE2211E
PFGLALAKGVSLTIDDQKLDGSLAFNTCQVVGCLVPVMFDATVTPLLKSGTTLKIDAFAADTGQAVSFSIPLNGFAGALARPAALLTPCCEPQDLKRAPPERSLAAGRCVTAAEHFSVKRRLF